MDVVSAFFGALRVQLFNQPLLDHIHHWGYYANSADPDQTPHNAPSDRGLHCLLTGISIQNTVNMITFSRKPLKFGNGLIEMIGLIDIYKTFKLCRFVFFQIVGIRD